MAKYMSPEAKARRAKQRRARRLALFTALTAFVLITAYGIVLVVEHFTTREKDPPIMDPTQTLQPNEDLEKQGAWATHQGPVQQTINNFEIISPDHRMIQLPENGSVDISYFDNATFVGDSLTEGLRIYPNISNSVVGHAQFVSTKSLSPKSFIDGVITFEGNYRPEQNGIDAICETYPGKLYITLGTNALVSMTDEQFMYYYNQMLDILKERLPGTLIYVCSITPTTAEYAEKKPNFSWDRVYSVNSQIAKMCNEKGMYYINLHEALADESGFLRGDIAAGDGIHLKPEGYTMWVEYLMKHTIHRPDNPYFPGSPYYKG
ncbi:MAG: GDSL-type esterase/lipase family protein [Oscillospiraceae bacterium]